MKTIIIPTDFSENSLHSLNFAINQLGNASTKYVIVHVYQIPQGGQSGLFYLLEEMEKQARKDMNDLEKQLKTRYPEHANHFKYKISQGDLPVQVNAIANDETADCIVTGTKGASGLKEVLIGSNTTALMNSLSKPLYAIPLNYQDRPIDKVVLAYDGKPFDEKIKDEIIYFAKKHDLKIEVCHVRTQEEDIIKDWSFLRDQLKGLSLDINEIYAEDLEQGLKKIAEKENTLLAMIRHKQSFWERLFNLSDSRKALMHAQQPMLIIPE